MIAQAGRTGRDDAAPQCSPGLAGGSTQSAEQLHRQALEAHRVGNRGRLALAQTLKIFKETGEYQALGFPSIVAYADKTFGYRKSEIYSMIQVVSALEDLPRCLEAFVTGALCWTSLRAIVEVATVETEERWLEFAREHTAEQLHRECRDAKDKRRDAPRADGYGLPALKRKLVLRLGTSEYEKYRQVLRYFGRLAAEKLGEESVSTEEAMALALETLVGQIEAEQGISGDAADGSSTDDVVAAGQAVPECGSDSTTSSTTSAVPSPARYALVYQACPHCERAGVHTPEGLVEVESSEVERIAPNADRVEVPAADDASVYVDEGEPVDRPTPSSMRRDVLLRDGERCKNPHCSSRAVHAHHIAFRSHGGRTVHHNLGALCGTCHALVHAGVLKISGPIGALRWERASDAMTRSWLDEQRVAAEHLPVVRLESTAVESANREGSNTVGKYEHEDDIVAALTRLRVPKSEALEKARKTQQLFGDSPHTLSDAIRTALSGKLLRSYRRPEGDRHAVNYR